jgi:hypothetical protein
MSRSAFILALLLGGTAAAWSTAQFTGGATGVAPAPAPPRYSSEQHWIASEVLAAIGGWCQPDAPPPQAALEGPPDNPSALIADVGRSTPITSPLAAHLWSPGTYIAVVREVCARPVASGDPAGRPDDHLVRRALADLRAETLLGENARISGVLARDPQSASAHEAAALLVGAFALRESWSLFGDVRPALSKLTAHLAIADTLRREGAVETLDGALGRVVQTLLTGHQRDALRLLDAAAPRAESAPDHAWVHALRLRITGDWRTPIPPTATSSTSTAIAWPKAPSPAWLERNSVSPSRSSTQKDGAPPSSARSTQSKSSTVV